MLKELDRRVNENSDPKRAEVSKRFFKTGKGEYGEGDVFVGLAVLSCRLIAREFLDLDLRDIEKLLKDKVHEKRLIGLLILVERFKKADERNKKEIYEFYLENRKKVNNWDLVDLSADKIVGVYLLDKDRKILYELARKEDLWEKRIAIISTFAFIRKDDFKDCLKISEILLEDNHDLIHKAVGWMLREVGKRDLKVLENFLKKHYKKMPRTMLRYAIEKFEEDKRKKYLRGEI